MFENLIREVADAIRASHNLLLVSHVRPDGDAVGSLLGLGLTLEANGKDVQMVLEDGVPSNFRHLPGASRIKTVPDGDFDSIIVLDCSDLVRTGNTLEALGTPQINIDHHPTNENFAAINLVIDSACSTTEILYEVLKFADFNIPSEAAAALLTGLITDTIGFRTTNVTSNALNTAAELVDFGLEISDLYRKALFEKSFEALKYWGKGLSTLERENGLVWATLSLSDREKVGYPGRDDADLVGQLSTIKGSSIRCIFVEQSDSEVKVSWRSQPEFDVSGVARQFGGGGHRTAAGATVSGSIEDVKARVLDATRGLLIKD